MYRGVLLMTARQCIRRGVLAAGFELDGELVDEQLAHPRVLGNRREPLVQEVLEAKVIGSYDERSRPKVGPLVPHGLDETDELTLVRRELEVMWRNGVGEECQWACTLVKHHAEVGARHITVNNEGLGEV
jgi:hypothetical protein